MGLSMKRWSGKAAIVTGAATGFGRAIAQKLIHEGMKVAGFDVKESALKKVKDTLKKNKENFFPVTADLRSEENTVKAIEWTRKNVGSIHVLINNAGVLCKEPLMSGKTQGWKDTIAVNVIGLCTCTREAMKDMIKHNINGHVIHVCSITGHYVPYGVPGWSVYPATKHAVTALTETMRQELNLQDSAIKIGQISPGFGETDLANDWQTDNTISKNIKSSKMKASDIADGVVYMLSTPPHVLIQDMVIRPVLEKA